MEHKRKTTPPAEILEQLKAAVAEEAAASGRVDELLAEAHRVKIPWGRIGEVLGVDAEKARWRLRSRTSNAPSLQTRKAGRSGEDLPAPRPAAGSGPGVSVAEAAERLGVTRAAVYNRIKSGSLSAMKDGAGYQRVLLDPPSDD